MVQRLCSPNRSTMARISSWPKPLRFSLLMCLLAALAISLFPLDSPSQLPVIRFVRDPDHAPDFKVKDLDGNDLSLEASKGKVVLLNFWATWCGPCRAEIPSLVRLQSRYKDRLQIIGMVVDDDDENAIHAVMKEAAINYPVALTTTQVRLAYGGIAALPTVFVIDPTAASSRSTWDCPIPLCTKPKCARSSICPLPPKWKLSRIPAKFS